MLVACDCGDKTSPNFVIGSIWAPREAFFNFETKSLELRLRNKCWGKLQWKKSKSSPNIIKTYIEFIDLFLNSGLFFNCIVINKKILRKFGQHMGRNIDESLPVFIYQLISRASRRYCERKISLHVLLDNEGLRVRRRICPIKQAITDYFLNDTELKDLVILEHLQECDSHICSSLQISDLLVGTISNKTNNRATSDANIAITKRIENKLSIDLSKRTPVGFKKLNIWVWEPYSLLKRLNIQDN